ncbi:MULTISPECIES: acyl-CoA dehydrogenase family protein [Vagococcus]|uniref:Acyl-CoA dehydrogenase, short-chain specific n=1 Tax=Vagococcus fluvialis bH819 TaxID=1255619 RepID=A0A1X6WLJ1_9ENTE|nr:MULTISPECIES: acyl-CoA dehydrogenase family protein [Vagococcus]SLM85137.1 Acyl-CoA dehydrogenase, short-chain specific [Vagococcus fluvialis bH819]HCM88448.1 acyl-CoA dehydrogenase [Vagococcus sp.]
MNQYYIKAKEFSNQHIAPFAQKIDAEGVFPREIMDLIAENGFLKLIIPKEHGGDGAGIDAQAYVSQAFGEGSATVGLCYTMHNVALKFILTFGSPELKDFITTEVVENNKMLSLARSEFGTGVHVFKSETSVQNFEDHSIINGTKSMITSANYADYYLISVPNDDQNRAVNWLVPYETEGLSFKENDWNGLGMRGNISCPMVMENMRLDNQFAVYIDREKANQKYPVNIDVIYFMTGLAGVYSGMTQTILEATVEHALSRNYPDKNLANIETVQIHLANIYASMLSAKSSLDNAVDSLMNEETDGLIKIMTARIIASENAIEAARLAMRVGGGHAYNKQGPIEMLLRDSFASQVMFPSIDVLKTWVGRGISDQPII